MWPMGQDGSLAATSPWGSRTSVACRKTVCVLLLGYSSITGIRYPVGPGLGVVGVPQQVVSRAPQHPGNVIQRIRHEVLVDASLQPGDIRVILADGFAEPLLRQTLLLALYLDPVPP